MIRSSKDFQVDLLCAAIEHFNGGMSRGVEYEVGWQTIDNNGTPIPKDKQKVQVWVWLGDDEEERKPTLSQQQEWVNAFLESVEGGQFLGGYLRLFRDSLLQDLDTFISNPLRWNGFTEAEQQALAAYRQALLDVPQQDGFPDAVDWPAKPEFL